MTKLNQIRARFLEASQITQYQNKWFPDVAWVQIMKEHYNFDSVTKLNINPALPDLQQTPPLKLQKNTRRIKLSNNKSTNGYFYLIDNKYSTQKRFHKERWEYLYEHYTIPRKRRHGKSIVDCCEIIFLISKSSNSGVRGIKKGFFVHTSIRPK